MWQAQLLCQANEHLPCTLPLALYWQGKEKRRPAARGKVSANYRVRAHTHSSHLIRSRCAVSARHLKAAWCRTVTTRQVRGRNGGGCCIGSHTRVPPCLFSICCAGTVFQLPINCSIGGLPCTFRLTCTQSHNTNLLILFRDSLDSWPGQVTSMQ